MKIFDEVTKRLTNELKFLEEEGKDSLSVAEAALKVAMIYTIAHAPNAILGFQLICKCHHDVINVAAHETFPKGEVK